MSDCFVIENGDEFSIYVPTSENQESYFGLVGKQVKKKKVINKQNKMILRHLNENVDENSGKLFSMKFFTAFLPLYIKSINEQMDTLMTPIERASSWLSVVLSM